MYTFFRLSSRLKRGLPFLFACLSFCLSFSASFSLSFFYLHLSISRCVCVLRSIDTKPQSLCTKYLNTLSSRTLNDIYQAKNLILFIYFIFPPVHMQHKNIRWLLLLLLLLLYTSQWCNF